MFPSIEIQESLVESTIQYLDTLTYVEVGMQDLHFLPEYYPTKCGTSSSTAP